MQLSKADYMLIAITIRNNYDDWEKFSKELEEIADDMWRRSCHTQQDIVNFGQMLFRMLHFGFRLEVV